MFTMARTQPDSVGVGNATLWIDYILKASLAQRASDIHIEPRGRESVTRFRIDGVMREVDIQRIEYHEAIISRLKVLANLNTVEKNIPQDGHIEIVLKFDNLTDDSIANLQDLDKRTNFRLSIMPTVYGEAAVIRALNRAESVMSLGELGFSEPSLEATRRILKHSSGMIHLTGPSGSGKTTTLYSIKNTYDVSEKTILTLEDPVEYQFERFRQTQVAPERGLSFALGLRTILRQDPDIIMIGEIRDQETAEIAVSAALSGRLVFSTFHTNDVGGVIFRMRDMGIGKAMIAQAVAGVIAERLVRRICTGCRVEAKPPKDMLDLLHIQWPGGKAYQGQGCSKCAMTGYYGRIGIFEVLEITHELKTMIVQGAPVDVMEKFIQHQVTETLQADGFNKVHAGVTTIEEVLKTTF